MIKILFTGFEPFGGSDRNPSADAVTALPDTLDGGEIRIVKAILPVSYRRAAAGLADAIGRNSPDAVVCCGLAAGRRAVTPEWGAINVDDTAAPDNDGVVLRRAVIDPDGPAALLATLDPYAVADAINAACGINADSDKSSDGGKNADSDAITAAVSYSAGEYVCNHTYYTLLRTGVPGLFIHIPASVPPAVLEAAAIEVARQVCEGQRVYAAFI